MKESDIYVGLDIGTTSIKAIVAQTIDGQTNVIGVGNEPSAGVSRGIIVDIDKAAQAIRKTLDQAEAKSGVQISSVIVGLPADLVSIDRCSGMISLTDSTNEINNQDIQAVTQAAISNNLPQEREVINLLPEEFKIGEFDDIADPRGMVGTRLELDGRLITGPKTIIHNVRKAVEQAGISIDQLVVGAEAEGKTALSESEQDFGTILLDLGGGQSTAAVIHDHELKYIDVDHEGGQYITKDISSVLNISLADADNIKREYGIADAQYAVADNEFSIEVVGQSQPRKINEQLLAEIIEARLDQILGRLKDKLAAANALGMPGGIVLTGGVASMPKIAELAANTFGMNVRVYVPDKMGLRHPSFALGLSLVNYATQMSDVEQVIYDVFATTSHGEPAANLESEPEQDPDQYQDDAPVTDDADDSSFFSRRGQSQQQKKRKKNGLGFSLKNFFE
ncbi:cell division protein FtsA [Fructilactobacillus carniphilus]|uniref:Cell division protein FtsA n=1 Tax=Fructilactobacillus carniphilus TaxID=2940297 RepID=A0ABY5C0T6_9LACO|nr:cell division protein FtsA [Fructilactobacillus carniphilus]USS90895.1 cell division protein FtsA [Fructilactobacillus carniphilus]